MIDLKDYDHLESESSFDFNYYKHKVTGDEILIDNGVGRNETDIYSNGGGGLIYMFTHYGEDTGVYCD